MQRVSGIRVRGVAPGRPSERAEAPLPRLDCDLHIYM